MSRCSLGRPVDLPRLYEYSDTVLFVAPFVWGENIRFIHQSRTSIYYQSFVYFFKFVSDLARLCIQDDCPNHKAFYAYFAVTATADGGVYRRCRQLSYLGIRDR